MNLFGKKLRHGDLACSFCGKSQRMVRKLVAGPNVYICDECIGLCGEIMVAERAGDPAAKRPPPSEDDPQVLAALLVKACESDPRIPRVITDLATSLASALARHLGTPGS